MIVRLLPYRRQDFKLLIKRDRRRDLAPRRSDRGERGWSTAVGEAVEGGVHACMDGKAAGRGSRGCNVQPGSKADEPEGCT